MGKSRVCGGVCHKAKGPKCRCWCGGVFHGAGSAGRRAEFAAAFGLEKVPNTEQAFLEVIGQPDFWGEAAVADEWRRRIKGEAGVDGCLPAPL